MPDIDLTGRRVLVPGGTGAVGEGVVRSFLAAGADVVVPTRTQQRADDFHRVLGDAATGRLHLVVHDYTTFAGAADLAGHMVDRLGGIDDVVAPIGGWWAGKSLTGIDARDWRDAFVGLATTHVAVLRAALPHLGAHGAYTVIVGASAFTPVPGSSLVSMEQAALLMMQQVAQAESGADKRVFALVLGPVRTRAYDSGDPDQISAGQVGAMTVAISAVGQAGGQEIRMRDQSEARTALARLTA